MSENVEESSESEHDENQCGIVLGFWDHEKTPNLIKDLEQSVNSVEQKCKKLLEELIYYKKFLEESDPRQSYRTFKKEKQKTQNSRLLCGSDPDISLRKNLMSNLQLAQIFEQKFQEKLYSINQELAEAADKIGLKNNIVLFSADDYLKTIHSETQQHIDKTWSEICQEFLKMNYYRSKTRSDTMVSNLSSEDYSKITKRDLKLYQKLSRISMKKKKRRRRKEGRRLKFACMKKPFSRMEGTYNEKKRKRRIKFIDRGQNKTLKETSDIQLMCRSLTEAIKKKNEEKPKEQSEEGKATLGSAIRKVVPFTTCTSTSRSYNIGVNVQQFLSQMKYEKAKNPEKKKQSSRGGEKGQAGWNPQTTFQSHDDVWISEHHTSSNIRKVRSKYTGSAPDGYVEYHKSTMSQYTNGQKSMIKSESKTAYAIGSKIMVSDCRRTDYYQIDKDSRYYASGDGRCNGFCDKINMDWSKVYGAFLDIYKKYTELKKNIIGNETILSAAEIELLENEIEEAMKKYKNFLHFYSKFLQLKHRLKTLKMSCETKMFDPVTSFPPNFERKMSPGKPTYSMAMKKALREIQDLQEKIRLIRDY